MKTTTVPLKHWNRVPCALALLMIPLALACFVLSPQAQAVDPPPDGGYPNQNTAEGEDALFNLDASQGHDNTAIGFGALFHTTTGFANTAIGSSALYNNTTGVNNTAIGFLTLFNNIDGFHNTALGHLALLFNTSGTNNVATGAFALEKNTTGDANTANGVQTLFNNTTGDSNTATGDQSLLNNTTGTGNTATGRFALQMNTTGSNNIAVGLLAGWNLTSGDNNIALGANAGLNLNTGSNNIDIGNEGLAGEFDTIRIGKQETQTRTFIAGIAGAAINGRPVMVNANGRLGTAPSSARFKQDIKPMDKASEAILALKPVTFRYKHKLDPVGNPQFGLVAEDVEKVNPDLVVRDEQGKPYTVRYEVVNAMLLNEFLKEHQTVQELKKQVAELTAGLQKVSAQIELGKHAPDAVVTNQ